MKSFLFTLIALFVGFQAHAGPQKIVVECSTDRPSADGSQIRVQIYQLENSVQLAGRVTFGAADEGVTYKIYSQSNGNYWGPYVPNHEHRVFVTITGSPAQNRYIRGSWALLNGSYPTTQNTAKKVAYSVTRLDNFVCGKRIQ